MKKNILFTLFITFLIFPFLVSAYSCDYDWKWQLWTAFQSCLSTTNLAWAWDDMSLNVNKNWFKDKVLGWRNTLAVYLWVAAVFWLTFAAFKMVTSAWKDENISNAKKMATWIIFWFLGVMFASTIIIIVIELFYRI